MAPKFCCQCAKKPTRTRIINPATAVCNECSDIGAHSDNLIGAAAAAPDISDDTALSDIRFGDLKKWLHYELHTNIKQIVKDELKTELGEIKKNVSDLKGDVKKNKDLSEGNSSRIDKVNAEVQSMIQQNKDDT